MKIYKYIAGFFIATTIIFVLMYKYENFKTNKLENEKKALIEENKTYSTKLEKVYNDKMELDRKYKELEKAAKSDKNFDWFVDISNSDVIKRLRE